MSRARTGKIARCPLHIREQINQRLLDGEPATKIINWLHEQPEVLAVLDRYFREEPISPQNMSEWRAGGYQDWLQRREVLAKTKSNADYAFRLAKEAGGNISDGAAALLGGMLLEAVEKAAEAGEEPCRAESPNAAEVDADTPRGPDINGLVEAVVALRRTDLEARKVGQRQQLLDQRERQVALAEKQFQVRTCELFLTWFTDKRAHEIVESKAKKEVKIEQLRLRMFGELPAEEKN